MQLKFFSECRLDLNFNPLRSWPIVFPSIALDEWVIAGFEKVPTDPVLSYPIDSQQSLMLFKACYPSLSFVELFQFLEKAAEKHWISAPLWWESYQYRNHPLISEVKTVLPQCPLEFLFWAAQKQMQPHELLSLKSFIAHPQTFRLLKEWVVMNPSHGIGSQTLQLWADLIHEHDLTPLPGESAEVYLLRMKHLRYPKTMARDAEKQKSWEKISFPKGTQKQFLRKGDESGLEIRFFAKSHEDLIHSLTQTLTKVSSSAAKQELKEKERPACH